MHYVSTQTGDREKCCHEKLGAATMHSAALWELALPLGHTRGCRSKGLAGACPRQLSVQIIVHHSYELWLEYFVSPKEEWEWREDDIRRNG